MGTGGAGKRLQILFVQGSGNTAFQQVWQLLLNTILLVVVFVVLEMLVPQTGN